MESMERWRRENVLNRTVYFNRKSDREIIDWLKGKPFTETVKALIRERIERESSSTTKG